MSETTRHGYSLNEIISVRAWWWPDNRLTKCIVLEFPVTARDIINVRPIVGSTHQRWVRVGRDFDARESAVQELPKGVEQEYCVQVAKGRLITTVKVLAVSTDDAMAKAAVMPFVHHVYEACPARPKGAA